ncbi:MAG TPA: DUF2993 domain-containing protein [Candidatus Obscuribacterales bacterium]
MEWITIILSSFFTLISPVGLVADQVVEGAIRDRLYRADLIDVRIDNAANFQLVGGRVDRVRLAGRGVYPVPDLRIDTLDIETDPIDIDLPALQRGKFALDEPIKAASHIILNVDDLNGLLRSPAIQTRLDDLRFNLPGASDRERNRYGLANPQVEVLPENRLRVTIDLEDRVAQERVEALVEGGFVVVDGHQLVLTEPTIVIDNQPVPPQLITAFTEGIKNQLTLKQLEEIGIVARVLKFELQPEALDVVIFLQINPDSPLIAPRD